MYPHSAVWRHSSFINSSGITNLGFQKSWCAPISLKLPLSCSRAKTQTFYVINTHLPFSFTDSTNRCTALHTRHLDSVWRRKFFLLWNSSIEVLVILIRIRIFKCPELFMPELLIKVLWYGGACLSFRDIIILRSHIVLEVIVLAWTIRPVEIINAHRYH